MSPTPAISQRMFKPDLTLHVGPVYAWLRTYSHTNRRHVLQFMSEIASSLDDLPSSPGTSKHPAFICSLHQNPLPHSEAGDALWEPRDQQVEMQRAGTWDNALSRKPLLGAVWNPLRPQFLPLASTRSTDPGLCMTYSEIMADPQEGWIPLVLNLLDPATARP